MSHRKQLDSERPEAGVGVGLRAHRADIGADEGAPSAYRDRTRALRDSKQALLASNHCKGHLLVSMLWIVSVAGISQSLTEGWWSVTKAPGAPLRSPQRHPGRFSVCRTKVGGSTRVFPQDGSQRKFSPERRLEVREVV